MDIGVEPGLGGEPHAAATIRKKRPAPLEKRNIPAGGSARERAKRQPPLGNRLVLEKKCCESTPRFAPPNAAGF